jgi:hypothetical protein
MTKKAIGRKLLIVLKDSSLKLVKPEKIWEVLKQYSDVRSNDDDK